MDEYQSCGSVLCILLINYSVTNFLADTVFSLHMACYTDPTIVCSLALLHWLLPVDSGTGMCLLCIVCSLALLHWLLPVDSGTGIRPAKSHALGVTLTPQSTISRSHAWTHPEWRNLTPAAQHHPLLQIFKQIKSKVHKN